jgi:hypothetical protein
MFEHRIGNLSVSRHIWIASWFICALSVPVLADASQMQVRELFGGSPYTRPTRSGSFPSFQTLKEYTFEAGAQGWTSHDLTAQSGNYWHVDDFAGLAGYAALSGSKSFWCGVRPSVPQVPAMQYAPGYGDNWTQTLQSQGVATTPGQAIELSAMVSCDFADTDFLSVEYRTHLLGLWTTLASYTGQQSGTFQWTVPGNSVGSLIQFRFVVSSDILDSDEYGVDTHGAALLDNISARYVSSGVFILPVDDFESAAVGAQSDAYWSSVVGGGFFDYAFLISGTQVEQMGTPNNTQVWSFLSSTDHYDCGGFPTQEVVPYGRVSGSRHPGHYLSNEVRSPFIDLSIDRDGQPVDPVMSIVTLEFDVYADLIFATNRVLYGVRSRFMVGGVPTEWDAFDTFFSSPAQTWIHVPIDDMPQLDIPAGATHVQVGLVVLDFAYADGAIWMCHSPAPMFDNVSIHRTTGAATGVGDDPLPARLALRPNIPNPFNPSTTIAYDVPSGGADVTIEIFDVQGSRVRTLLSRHHDAGRYATRWNGEDDRSARVASGVYFCRMTAEGFTQTRKMVLVR